MSSEVVSLPDKPVTAVRISRQPHGGYLVMTGTCGRIAEVEPGFATLDLREAVDWAAAALNGSFVDGDAFRSTPLPP